MWCKAGVLSDDRGACYPDNLGPKLRREVLYQLAFSMMKAPTGGNDNLNLLQPYGRIEKWHTAKPLLRGGIVRKDAIKIQKQIFMCGVNSTGL